MEIKEPRAFNTLSALSRLTGLSRFKLQKMIEAGTLKAFYPTPKSHPVISRDEVVRLVLALKEAANGKC